MKVSKKSRWILAVFASLAVLSVEIFVTVNMLPGLENNSGLVLCILIAVLTGIMVAPLQGLHGKRFVTVMAVLFILTCLFPSWRYTADRNGSDGYHSRNPAGYFFILAPPTNPDPTVGNGVQIDFGRLFLEWAALAAATGMVWVLVVNPAWSRDDKSNCPQKFTSPRPPRIVMVDDQPIILNHLEKLIRECFKDATVLKFNDGDQVWQELLRTEPDLLITDMVRPGLSGWKMLPLLAAKKVTFPIIVMSGGANEKDVRKCAGSELNFSFLAKPFTQIELHQELLKHLAGISGDAMHRQR